MISEIFGQSFEEFLVKFINNTAGKEIMQISRHEKTIFGSQRYTLRVLQSHGWEDMCKNRKAKDVRYWLCGFITAQAYYKDNG